MESTYWSSEKCMEYHKRQIENPYRSTVYFEDFLKRNVDLKQKKVLDLACGAGGPLSYMSEKNPDTQFTGVDLDGKLLQYQIPKENVYMEQGDWFNLDGQYVDYFDGVISLQSLGWIPDYETAIKKVCKLNPQWIAMSSLFYEGKITYDINLKNYERPTLGKDYTETCYNILSLPICKELFAKYGYTKFVYQAFEIDIDIEKPTGYDLGTYTIKTVDEKRIQISAAMMLPWYFIFASK